MVFIQLCVSTHYRSIKTISICMITRCMYVLHNVCILRLRDVLYLSYHYVYFTLWYYPDCLYDQLPYSYYLLLSVSYVPSGACLYAYAPTITYSILLIVWQYRSTTDSMVVCIDQYLYARHCVSIHVCMHIDLLIVCIDQLLIVCNSSISNSIVWYSSYE